MNATTNDESFADRLPNELLIQIFKHISPYPAELLVVTTVCSRWRSVALAAPELWSNIIVAHDMDDIPRSNMFLKRSQNSLLSIHFSHWISLFTALPNLSDHLPRTRRLELLFDRRDSQSRSDYKRLFTFEEDTIIPTLEHLLLHDYSWSEGFDVTILSGVSAQCLPSLRSMNLLGVLPDISRPFLHLSYLSIHALEYASLRDIFAAAPVLTTLVLPGYSGPDGEDAMSTDDASLTVSQSLRSLAFTLFYNHSETECNCPLSRLHAPGLERLEIAGKDELRIPENAHGLLDRKKHPKLKTLRLDRLSTQTDESTSAVPFIPSLERLELVHMDGHLTAFGSPDMPDLLAFPKLASVYLESIELNQEHVTWLSGVGDLQARNGRGPLHVEIPKRQSEEDEGLDIVTMGPNVIVEEKHHRGLMSVQDYTIFDDYRMESDEGDWDLGYSDYEEDFFGYDDDDSVDGFDEVDMG